MTIKNNKYIKQISDEILYFKEIKLEEIYQNSPEIAKVLMEKNTYKLYGCRVTGIYRTIKNELNNLKVSNSMTLINFDNLLDQTIDSQDAWTGNITDVMNGQIAIDRVNKLYKTNLKYNYKKILSINDVRGILDKDHVLTIRMPSLVSGSHYINLNGYAVMKNGSIYFKQKETYTGYDGYNYYQDLISDCYEWFE